jgi:hypothetical protein
VNAQRSNKDRLSPERIQKLDSIGFVWNSNDAYWGKMYMRLVDYKKQHGHCTVPRSWEEDGSLARWVSKQRYNKLLSTERRQLLKALGFWNSRVLNVPPPRNMERPLVIT